MKNKRYVLTIIACFLLCSVLLVIIKINMDFLKIRTEWESIFRDRKSDFKSLNFSGEVINKNFIKKAYLPYSLTILLDTNTVIPEWGKISYPQYYEFDSEKNILKFSVPKYVYDNVELNFIIEKKEKLDSLYINNKAYELLSAKPLEWFPK